MSETNQRSTIYFESDIHAALRRKAAETRRSLSALVNEALRHALTEDQEDLAAFEACVAEPVMSYAALRYELKAQAAFCSGDH